MKAKEILLIDDNNIDNYINKYIIDKMDISEKTTAITSPVEALIYLRTLETAFPDIIFLDIKMPEMDGFGFLEAYNKFSDKQKNNCMIIMLTSSHNINDIERASQNQYVKKYLNKPLDQSKTQEAYELWKSSKK